MFEVLEKEWNPEQEAPIEIDRDGRMFRYIAEFHHHGELPFKSKKASLELVRKIQAEADHYNLPELVEACEKYAVSRVSEYLNNHNITCEYQSDSPDHLLNLISAVWAPFCLPGYKRSSSDCTILKSSTLHSLNIDELCDAAVPISFGKESEPLNDLPVQGVFEIPAEQLNPALWKEFHANMYPLHQLAPRKKLVLRPIKLVIYKEGGHFTELRDSVRGENHIGTLVQILDSKFTDGELVIGVVGREDFGARIRYPYKFVAMYNETPRRMEPVTSGTRVELIFDIYDEGVVPEDEFFSDETRFERPVASEIYARDAVDAETCTKIHAALDKALEKYDDVVICLPQLYPMCKEDPARLKGGDALLYKHLTQRESELEVSMVPVKVKSSIIHDDTTSSYLTGALVDLEYELSGHCYHIDKTTSTLMWIPLHCSSSHILKYPEEEQHESYESEPAEETIYLVTGFRITKRVAPTITEEPAPKVASVWD